MGFDNDKTILGDAGEGDRRVSLVPGDRLGDYRIVRWLGSGAMGEVYEAEQVHLGRRYAVKVLPASLSNDSRFGERFRNEARLLASLNHPNVVSVVNAGEVEGRFFLVMELLAPFLLAPESGREDKVNRHRDSGSGERRSTTAGSAKDADGVTRVRSILSQILSGLDYAHGKGIVHRDLKPANLLRGNDGTVMIADFGVAQVVGDEFVKTVVQETIARTRMGDASTVMGSASSSTSDYAGTLQYMAPEILEGEPATAKSDLYAVGVMAYEWLTGRKPAGRYKDASRLVEGLDPAWDVWIDLLLQQDVEDRPSGADEALKRIPGEGYLKTNHGEVANTGDRSAAGPEMAGFPEADPEAGEELSGTDAFAKSDETSRSAPMDSAESLTWRSCLTSGARVSAGAVLSVFALLWWIHGRPSQIELLHITLFFSGAFVLLVPVAASLVRGMRFFRKPARRRSAVLWLMAAVPLQWPFLGFAFAMGGLTGTMLVAPIPWLILCIAVGAAGKAVYRRYLRKHVYTSAEAVPRWSSCFKFSARWTVALVLICVVMGYSAHHMMEPGSRLSRAIFELAGSNVAYAMYEPWLDWRFLLATAVALYVFLLPCAAVFVRGVGSFRDRAQKMKGVFWMMASVPLTVAALFLWRMTGAPLWEWLGVPLW